MALVMQHGLELSEQGGFDWRSLQGLFPLKDPEDVAKVGERVGRDQGCSQRGLVQARARTESWSAPSAMHVCKAAVSTPSCAACLVQYGELVMERVMAAGQSRSGANFGPTGEGEAAGGLPGADCMAGDPLGSASKEHARALKRAAVDALVFLPLTSPFQIALPA